ncbi:MAG: hypothetical protein ACE5JO_08440 [Candidatus Binatia bacterium]
MKRGGRAVGNTDQSERPPLLNTKLIPPRLPPAWLPRPRLFDELQKGLARKLTVVSAGAGCGKSVLLASYVNSSGLPFVWYNLDSGDRDPMVFLSYLIKGIQGQFKGFSSKALNLIKEGRESGPSWERILATLMNEVLDTLPKSLLIVLEDYHLVEDTEGLRGVLNYLLRYLPPNLHLFLSSRRKPNLNLPKFRSQGEIMELKAGDLSFTRQEIRSLFSEIYRLPLSPQDLERLGQHTEGWIMGLQLIAEVLRGKSPQEISASLVGFKGSRGYLFHYLNEEVFRGLPSATQLFLKQSSIFRSFQCPTVRLHLGGDGRDP